MIFSPGHTDDSIIYRLSDDSAIFTGDTLFIECVGYCNPKIMFRTIEEIKKLQGSNLIYSGHDYGSVPFRSLAEEKLLNPYLACSNYDDFLKTLRNL